MVGSQDATIRQLREDVRRLEERLGSLHGTDVVELSRAHHSLKQHVGALAEESSGFEGGIVALQTTLFQPAHAAAGATKTVVTAVLAAVAHMMLRPKPNRSGPPVILRSLPWVLGTAYLATELARGFGRRLVVMLAHNRATKRALLSQWAVLSGRIEIMSALVAPPPPPAHPAADAAHLVDSILPSEEDYVAIGDGADFVSVTVPPPPPEPRAGGRADLAV